MIVTDQNADGILDYLKTQSVFVVDIESTGLDVMTTDFLCGIGVGTASGEAWYFPFRHKIGDNIDLYFLTRLLRILEGKTLIGHNLKFDIKGLYKEGFNYKLCVLLDTIVMARLCSKIHAPRLDLENLLATWIGVDDAGYKAEFKKYLKKNKIKGDFSQGDAKIVGEYCCGDVVGTFKLYLKLEKTIRLTMQQEVWDQEKLMTKVLLNMETLGVPIDREYCKKCIGTLTNREKLLINKVHELVGYEFDIGSGPQLTTAMNSLGIHSPVRTPKDKESWDNNALKKIDHPVAEIISNYRTNGTLKNTFFGPLYDRDSDLIFTSFKNWGTVTGRLSCMDPNLQNIPKFMLDLDNNATSMNFNATNRAEAMESILSGKVKLNQVVGDETVAVRNLFVPSRPGSNLFSMDFSQMEVVVLLYFIKDEELLSLVKSEEFDFHVFVAIEALGGNPDDPEFEAIRAIAKSITFGVIYGMGIASLAIQLGKTENEAKMFRQRYYDRIPKAKPFINDLKAKIERGEYVYNGYNRRYVITPDKAYIGINYLVQGTSGDIIKENMIHIDKFLEDKKSKMLIQIHDELLFDIDEEEEESGIVYQIASIMKTNRLGIPLNVDVKKCKGSWANKEKYEFRRS